MRGNGGHDNYSQTSLQFMCHSKVADLNYTHMQNSQSQSVLLLLCTTQQK